MYANKSVEKFSKANIINRYEDIILVDFESTQPVTKYTQLISLKLKKKKKNKRYHTKDIRHKRCTKQLVPFYHTEQAQGSFQKAQNT